MDKDLFNGKKIICGGTTAKIVSRELDRKVTVDLNDYDPEIPPCCIMEGIDLVTEGTITLSKILELLEKNVNPNSIKQNAAAKVLNQLLNSDIINFVVGTKINEAHQDPTIPFELGIRKNLINKLVKVLEEKYLKETKVQFV